jgi:PAS domain-containing protein
MSPEIINIIIGLLSTIGGGGLVAAYFKFYVERRKTNADISETLHNRLLEEIKRIDDDRAELELQVKILTENEESCSRELRSLSEELRETKIRLSIFESSHYSIPLPFWSKDLDGKMRSVNRAYETAFLRPHGLLGADYIGNYDHDVWPREIADAFRKHDAEAIVSSKGFIEFEQEILASDGTNLGLWRVIKYCRYENDVLVGVSGIAWPLQSHNMALLDGM